MSGAQESGQSPVEERRVGFNNQERRRKVRRVATWIGVPAAGAALAVGIWYAGRASAGNNELHQEPVPEADASPAEPTTEASETAPPESISPTPSSPSEVTSTPTPETSSTPEEVSVPNADQLIDALSGYVDPNTGEPRPLYKPLTADEVSSLSDSEYTYFVHQEAGESIGVDENLVYEVTPERIRVATDKLNEFLRNNPSLAEHSLPPTTTAAFTPEGTIPPGIASDRAYIEPLLFEALKTDLLLSNEAGIQAHDYINNNQELMFDIITAPDMKPGLQYTPNDVGTREHFSRHFDTIRAGNVMSYTYEAYDHVLRHAEDFESDGQTFTVCIVEYKRDSSPYAALMVLAPNDNDPRAPGATTLSFIPLYEIPLANTPSAEQSW